MCIIAEHYVQIYRLHRRVEQRANATGRQEENEEGELIPSDKLKHSKASEETDCSVKGQTTRRWTHVAARVHVQVVRLWRFDTVHLQQGVGGHTGPRSNTSGTICPFSDDRRVKRNWHWSLNMSVVLLPLCVFAFLLVPCSRPDFRPAVRLWPRRPDHKVNGRSSESTGGGFFVSAMASGHQKAARPARGNIFSVH